mmetsp:Transcript_82637/g.129075  ORF Transcript_82637/g.129075 Transcript_82637/m.129075 type:complete len:553 (-) Transcript_82637:21-1679(-)
MSWGPKPGELRGGLGIDRNISYEIVPTANQAGYTMQDKQNLGYSGTPMWKLALERQQQNDMNANASFVKLPDGFKPVDAKTAQHLPRPGRWYFNEKIQVFWNALDDQRYIWDPVSQKYAAVHEAQTHDFKIAVGACFHDRAVQVKHVLVNDLAKAAQAMRMSFDHVDRPCAMYALYEGHRGSAANSCAEFCAKHLHLKLLPKLAAFRGFFDDERLEAVMQDSFAEVDAEFAEKHPSATDGCCASVALIIGRRLVVASLGDVPAVVCMKSGEAVEQLKPHAVKDPDDDDDDDDEAEEDSALASSGAADDLTSAGARPLRWTRAFGDLEFKAPDSIVKLTSKPDVAVIHLESKHRGFAFVCRALYNAIGRAVAVSTVFRRSAGRPRMASGALVDAAVQWLGQVGDLGLGSIVVSFDRLEDDGDRPAKKQRVEQAAPSQVRLRHILLKHRECKSTVDKVRNKQVKRSRGEAERMLRAVLEECVADQKKSTFSQRAREMSECQSCLKTGDLSGDLGWVKPGKHGQAFDAAAFSLQVGQLSDLVDSDQGIHIILRSA